jgi:Ran GTPase-activating protein (RanGAP) involved in mRNA processing and transport
MEQSSGNFITHNHKGEVNFSNRKVREIDALIKFLKIFWGSKVLVLNNCRLTDDHIVKILHYIKLINVEIHVLSLKDNLLTSKSCEYLYEYLQQKNSLESLDLSDNQIGLKGLEHITEVLKHNTTIKKLVLDNCSIRAESKENQTMAFINDIQNNVTCTELTLTNNKID